MEAIQEGKRYTYADYASWDTEDRYELIDGIPYKMEFGNMQAAPAMAHQAISGELFFQLYSFLKGKPCKVFAAPFDVRLNGDSDDDEMVVQPDIAVICDQSKLDDKGCNGAPDMVVEVVSPTSSGRDRILKFNKYLQAGVREYWIVDPAEQSLTAHVLKDGEYITKAYGAADTAPVHVLEGCSVNLADVFAE